MAEPDTLTARFIYEGGQTSVEIAQEMATFIGKATRSVHLAAYDCRLDEEAAGPIRTAIQDRLSAGVDVRLIYDASQKKPQSHGQFEQIGGDFAEEDEHHRVEELGSASGTNSRHPRRGSDASKVHRSRQ